MRSRDSRRDIPSRRFSSRVRNCRPLPVSPTRGVTPGPTPPPRNAPVPRPRHSGHTAPPIASTVAQWARCPAHSLYNNRYHSVDSLLSAGWCAPCPSLPPTLPIRPRPPMPAALPWSSPATRPPAPPSLYTAAFAYPSLPLTRCHGRRRPSPAPPIPPPAPDRCARSAGSDTGRPRPPSGPCASACAGSDWAGCVAARGGRHLYAVQDGHL